MAIPFRLSGLLLMLGSLVLCAGTALAGNAHRDVVSRVSPVYPELAHRMRVGGKVVLIVDIKPDGTVSSTRVQSGHPLLLTAAQDAVHRWRFSPAPEATESEVEVSFNIDNR